MQAQIYNYAIFTEEVDCVGKYDADEIAATWNDDKNALICYCESQFPGDIKQQL